jgi:hypothetical protein
MLGSIRENISTEYDYIANLKEWVLMDKCKLCKLQTVPNCQEPSGCQFDTYSDMDFNWENYGGNLILNCNDPRYLFDTDNELYEERYKKSGNRYWHFIDKFTSVGKAEMYIVKFLMSDAHLEELKKFKK